MFEAAADLSEDEREALLADQADPQIVAEVRALLAADDGDEGPLDRALIPAPHGLAPGTMVGEYEVVSRLGAGAFGVVYLARHPMLDKRAAVKVLDRRFASDETALERFLTEARAASGIGHSGIADVFGFGSFEDGSRYYVMAYIDGPSLDAFVREHAPVALDVAVGILAPLADALDAAHRRGVVHRDLKPANVMLQRGEDGQLLPKLVDFGIAKLIDEDEGGPKLTQTGMTLGTPAYMAPEQAKATRVDAAADRYALGVIAFELLTGRRPFVAETTIETMMKHVSEPPPKPTSIRPELGARVDAAVLAMLAKAPQDRPPTATAAIRALRDAATGASNAPGPDAPGTSAPSLAPNAPGTSASDAAPSLAPNARGTSASDTGPSLAPNTPGTSAPSLAPSASGTSAPDTAPSLAPNAPGTSPPDTAPSLAPNAPGTSAHGPRSSAPPMAPLPSTPAADPSAPPHAPTSSTTKKLGRAALLVGMGVAAVIGFAATRDEAPAPSVELAPPAPAPAPPPPAPIRTDVRVVGEPVGAQIFDEEGRLLGALPATITLEDPKATHIFVVKKRGYESTRLEFVPAERPRLRVRLEKKLHQDLESPF